MKQWLILCGLVCVTAALMQAQVSSVDTIAPVATTGALRIETTIDSATVLLDSNWVGVTPLMIDTVSPGWHTLHIIQPDLENWLTASVQDSVFLQPGDNRTLRYELRPRYMILSHPFGAEVLMGDSVLGTTPIVLKSSKQLETQGVVLQKPGYEDAQVSLLSHSRQVIALDLKKQWQKGDVEYPIFNDEDGSGGSEHLHLYLTGAATIFAGAAAAYFKIKADNNYDRYQRTGDPGLLRETRRLDTAAAVSLAATQVGLGLFTYFILSE